MVRDLNLSKREALKSELKNIYPELTNDDLNAIDNSFEQLVNSIVVKTQKNKVEVEKLLVDRLDFINSKHLI